MSAWQHGADVAWTEFGTRRSLMNLERLDQPPLVLEGAAIIVHDAIDGTRDTDQLIAFLRETYPYIHTLEDDVRSCLEQFEATGIVRQNVSQ